MPGNASRSLLAAIDINFVYNESNKTFSHIAPLELNTMWMDVVSPNHATFPEYDSVLQMAPKKQYECQLIAH